MQMALIGGVGSPKPKFAKTEYVRYTNTVFSALSDMGVTWSRLVLFGHRLRAGEVW